MSETQVIDRRAFDELLASLGGDADFLAEMLATYFDDSARQLAAMESACAAGDGEQLRRAAHSLKSTSATLGARAFSANAREIEKLAEAGRFEEAKPRIASLLAEYAGVEQGLRDLCDGS